MNGFWEGLQWLVANEHWSGTDGIPHRVWEHVQVSFIALVIAAAIAVPLGLWVGHTRKAQFLTVQLSNVGRAIPSFAVLSIAFLLAVKLSPTLAFGFPPVVIALIVLAIPVILINTYVGIQQVEPDTVEAARGMGMSGRQILFEHRAAAGRAVDPDRPAPGRGADRRDRGAVGADGRWSARPLHRRRVRPAGDRSHRRRSDPDR